MGTTLTIFRAGYHASERAMNREEIEDSLALILQEISQYNKEIQAAEAAKKKRDAAQQRVRSLFAQYSRLLKMEDGS